MKRTRAQAADTRRAILCIAEEFFVQHNYKNVSVDEIAAAAGVTRGAIQWHFQNKAGLMQALFNEVCRPVHDLSWRLSAGLLDDPIEALANTLERSLLDLQHNHRDRRILLGYDSMLAANPELLVGENDISPQRFFFIIYRIFTEAEAKKLLSPPWTANTAANTLYHTIDGIMKKWLSDEATVNPILSDGVTIFLTILASCRGASNYSSRLRLSKDYIEQPLAKVCRSSSFQS